PPPPRPISLESVSWQAAVPVAPRHRHPVPAAPGPPSRWPPAARGPVRRRTTLARVKVLVIGAGAREHALCRALSLDPDVTSLHCAPAKAGPADLATSHAVDVLDGPAVADLAERLGADLVVVGPEAPLVAGVADAVRARGLPCFGPSAPAAR